VAPINSESRRGKLRAGLLMTVHLMAVLAL